MKRNPLIGIGGVLVTLVLVLVQPAPAARAESALPDKVDPALRTLMQERPLSLLPVIVEMQEAAPPFVGAANVNRANEALDLLRLYGTPVAGLALIDSAAGFANAPGIEAISLVPTVAYSMLLPKVWRSSQYQKSVGFGKLELGSAVLVVGFAPVVVPNWTRPLVPIVAVL